MAAVQGSGAAVQGSGSYYYPQFIKSIDVKDVAITTVALIAIGTVVTGSTLLGLGLLGNYVAFGLIGGGAGLLTIDVALAIVKKHLKSNVDISDSLNSVFRSFIAFDSKPEVLNDLNNFYRNLDATPTEEKFQELTSICSVLCIYLQDTLDPKEAQNNKDLINAILKLEIAIRKKLIKAVIFKENHPASEALQNLKSDALTYYFKDIIAAQRVQVTQISERLAFHRSKKDLSEQEALFIEKELNFWTEQLDLGQPVAIPKFFHCTKEVATMKLIGDSQIKYMHKGAYPGCFASTLPEVGTYGCVGYALSSLIETTAVIDSVDGKTYYPTLSQRAGEGSVVYGEVYDKQNIDFEDKQAGVQFWLGFQVPNGIPMKRPNIEDDPLAFYADTTIAYIFYDEVKVTPKSRVELEDYAKSIGVRCVTVDNLKALRRLINVTFPLSLPLDWMGNLKDAI